MRQLKGKVKENAREKRERKKEFMENKDKLFTVVLPTLGVMFALLAAFVYMSSRPKSVIEGWRPKAVIIDTKRISVLHTNVEIFPSEFLKYKKKIQLCCLCHSHCSKSSFFVQKFNFDFPKKLSIFLEWKTRENVVVWNFLAVDNFDFTRKIVKKNLSEELVKMLGFCQNWIFGQKFDFSNSVMLKTLE